MASIKQKKRPISEVIRDIQSEDMQLNSKSSRTILSKHSSTLLKGTKSRATPSKDIMRDRNHTCDNNRRLSKNSPLRKGQKSPTRKNTHFESDENYNGTHRISRPGKGIPQKKRTKRKQAISASIPTVSIPATAASIPKDLIVNRVNYDLSRHRDRFPGLRGENPLDHEEEYFEETGEHEDIDDDMVHDRSIEKSNKRARGPSKGDNLIPPEGKRWVVEFNERGQFIGESVTKLARKIGILSRLGTLFPIHVKWKQIPELSYEVFCDELEAEYDFQDHPKAWHFAIKSAHDKWKKWKSYVKKKYYEVYDEDDARLQNLPPRVEEDQWISLVRYWGTAEAKRVAERNRQNRKKKGDKGLQCLLGPISIAQKEYEMRKENPDIAYSTVYKACYTKKDGTCVISLQMEDLDKLIETSPMQDPLTASSFAKLAPKVFGPEHSGYVRGIGLGVCKQALITPSGRHANTIAKKLAAENKTLKEQLERSKKEMDEKFEAQNRMMEILKAEVEEMKKNGSNRHIVVNSNGRSNSGTETSL